MLADDFEALEGQVPLPPPDPHTQSWQERLALNLLFDLRTFCPFEGPPNTTYNFESGGPGVWGRVVLPERGLHRDLGSLANFCPPTVSDNPR